MSRYDWDLDKARVTGSVGIRRSASLVRAPFVLSNLRTRSTMTRVLPRTGSGAPLVLESRSASAEG